MKAFDRFMTIFECFQTIFIWKTALKRSKTVLQTLDGLKKLKLYMNYGPKRLKNHDHAHVHVLKDERTTVSLLLNF